MIKIFFKPVCIIILLLCFVTPTSKAQTSANPTDYYSALPEKLPNHPRLFFPGGQESAILLKARENKLLSQLVDVLRKEADKKLAVTPQIFIPHKEMLKVSREQISRVLTLAMAYRIFKEDQYAQKAEQELLNVCRFPSWNPAHFLDVAEMTTAVAIGYDWCYDFLSPSSRKIMEDAIRKNGFKPAWPIYKKSGKTPFNRENNWNMVCNAGMVNGALAIGDKYPKDAEKIINYAVRYTPNLLISFAPEGVFNEGPGYWSYNGMYMALFFDNLTRILHNDFGLTSYQGLENTASWYESLAGPSNKVFNFGDASDHIDYSATFFFLGKYYHRPETSAFYRNLLQSAIDEYNTSGNFDFPRFFFLSIPWFDDSNVAEEKKKEKLTVFNGVTDMLILNGSPVSDRGRLYLAAKTGKPRWSHNQLDGGSFVLDCDGERWAIDLGPDSYGLPDFWDYKPGGVRWNYFRNTNMGHNSLSIDNKIAFSDGQGEIINFSKSSPQPWGILDLSPYYPDQVTSLKRGFRLLSPSTVLVRDEIELNSEGHKISWRFFTNASVNIEGNRAVLSQNGKKFYITCLLPSGFVMKVFPAKPYSEKEKPITDVNIVEISLDQKSRECVIPVLLGNNPDDPAIKGDFPSEMKDWK